MLFVYDLVRLLLVALLAPIAFGPMVLIGQWAHGRWGIWGLVGVVPFLGYVGVFLFLILCGALSRLLVGRLAPGPAPAGSPAFLRWGFYTLFHGFALGELKPFLSTFISFQRLYFGLMGAKLGRRTNIAPYVTILEPCLVEIGDDVTLGTFANLATHLGKEDYSLLFGSIRIGSRTVLGGGAEVGPGVTIGEDCVIGARAALSPHVTVGSGVKIGPYSVIRFNCTLGDGCELEWNSVVEKGTRIPPKERWGGNPARPL